MSQAPWGAAATYQERSLSVSTPERLRPPARLAMSDLGLQSCGPFSGSWAVRIDCHAGYEAGERWLEAHGYAVVEMFTDGEGLFVKRWRRAFSRAELRGEAS